MAAKKTDEFMIVNRRTGKALQATGLDNGLVVEQASPQKTDAQTWFTVSAGESVKIFNKASGKVLDIMANGTVDGTWVQTWEDVDGDSQYWKILPLTATYKKIVNVMANKVLDIVDMSDEDGASAQIWEDVGGEGQQWKFVSLTAKAPAKTVKKVSSKLEQESLEGEKETLKVPEVPMEKLPAKTKTVRKNTKTEEKRAEQPEKAKPAKGRKPGKTGAKK